MFHPRSHKESVAEIEIQFESAESYSSAQTTRPPFPTDVESVIWDLKCFEVTATDPKTPGFMWKYFQV